MKKLFNHIISISVSIIMLLSAFNVVLPIISFAEETVYSGSFALNETYSLTDLNGNSENVKLDYSEGMISMAVSPAVTNDGRLFGTDFYYGYSWTDKSYTIVNESGKGTSGEVAYYSKKAISDIRFDTSYSVNNNFWLAKPLEFYASSDGITYNKIETIRNIEGVSFTNPNFTGVNSKIYDTYTFLETDDIHYVKVVSTINADNNFAKAVNRIFNINYNTYTKQTDYSKDFDIKNPYSVTDLSGNSQTVTFGGTEGMVSMAVSPAVTDDGRLFGTDYYYGYSWTDESYTVVNSSGNGVSGEVTYYSPSVIRDIRFDTSYSVDNNYWMAKPLEFYASSDGVTYNKIETERDIVGHTFTNPNFTGVNSKIYDTYTFAETDNVHYIKVVSTINADNYFAKAVNRIYGIEYNTYNNEGIPVVPSRYENEVLITPDNEDIVIECEDGVVLDSPKRINGGWGAYDIYTFIKGDIDKNVGAKPENVADGSIIIETYNDKPITDWSFGGICGPDSSWAGEFKIYASSNGENWREVEFTAKKGDAYIAAWGAYEYEYSGSFLPTENCKFLKITTNSGSFAFIPAYRYLLYSTDGYDPNNIPPADSYINRMEEKNYFEKGDDFYLFRTGSAAVEFDLHVTEPISDTPTIAVTAGTEKADSEVDYLSTAFRVLVKDNGDGTGEYRYYNSFYKSSQITHIKVTLNNAKFMYLDYNLLSGEVDTERRHYEDVPIVEPYDDLDLESVHSAFFNGEQNGISVNQNAQLHNNGSQETADWIGGKCGFLSAAGARDYSIIMETPYVHDFKFRYAFASEDSNKIRQLKVYGISEWDGEEVEIPLVRYLDEDYKNAGYKNYIFRPADQDTLGKLNYHWVRIEVLCETFTDYSELMEFTYFFDIPPVPSMPVLKRPTDGLKEMIDSFETPMLLTQDGGKAHELYNLKWIDFEMGYNGSDHFIMQESYGADAYIIYQCDGIKGFDIRGYKIITSTYDLQIFASEDGVEWTQIETEYLEKTLLSNWRACSYTADSFAIPENTNYLKLFFSSDMETDIDVVVSDVQIFYTGEKNIESSVEDTVIEENIPNEPELETGTGNTVEKTDSGRKKVIVRRSLNPTFLIIVGCGMAVLLAAVIIVTVVLIKKKNASKKLS